MQTPRLNGPKSKGNLRSPAPWPSGKAADCKSAIRRFDSDRRLYTAAASCSLPATGWLQRHTLIVHIVFKSLQ